jgi:hypothetical protein
MSKDIEQWRDEFERLDSNTRLRSLANWYPINETSDFDLEEYLETKERLSLDTSNSFFDTIKSMQ